VTLLSVVLAMAAALLLVRSPADLRIAQLNGSTRVRLRRPEARAILGLVGPAARRRRRAERLRVVRALAALASELEAGQPPISALAECAGEPAVWPFALQAARTGSDIADGLSADAARAPVLAQLAACWRAGAESGAGLAVSVQRLAQSARAAEDVHAALEAELSGPRATARTLAVLPVVGVGLGFMLGGDPVAWLLGTGIGRMCLLVGAALTGLGLVWTGRIARQVERLL
jgi:tight adherence protein B